MPYVIRKGKLHYEPNTGNGPCNRRLAGRAYRRVVGGVHVTKGTFHDPKAIPDPRAEPGRLPVDPAVLGLRQQVAEMQAHTAALRALRNMRRGTIPGGARRRQQREAV
ncbi:hypothetical protein [Microcystis phage Mae-Yong1326-1]|nr:hypothetical protein [Microcystis phage Mae-Yong1326-1]